MLKQPAHRGEMLRYASSGNIRAHDINQPLRPGQDQQHRLSGEERLMRGQAKLTEMGEEVSEIASKILFHQFQFDSPAAAKEETAAPATTISTSGVNPNAPQCILPAAATAATTATLLQQPDGTIHAKPLNKPNVPKPPAAACWLQPKLRTQPGLLSNIRTELSNLPAPKASEKARISSNSSPYQHASTIFAHVFGSTRHIHSI